MTRIRTRIDRVGSQRSTNYATELVIEILNLCTFIYFWRLIASRNVRQHDPDSNPDRSRGKPTLYQLRHGARNWNLNLCSFIYFWTLIASRNVRQCPGWNHETAIGWRSKKRFTKSRDFWCWSLITSTEKSRLTFWIASNGFGLSLFHGQGEDCISYLQICKNKFVCTYIGIYKFFIWLCLQSLQIVQIYFSRIQMDES